MSEVLKRVMCVDDEADILEVARMALETVGGLEVITCNSGREALDRIRQTESDIILLDVMMPGMDGPTLYSKLRAIRSLSRIPVAFMTAKVQPKEVASYIGLGSAGVIMKPFDPMSLTAEVESLWRDFHDRR